MSKAAGTIAARLLGKLRACMSPAMAIAPAAVILLCASGVSAQQTFRDPEAAATALIDAARTGDQQALAKVLGAAGRDIVRSGDDVADAAARTTFVAAYDAKHKIAMEGDNKAVMVIGQNDFPVPIPLVRRDGLWRFDSVAGRQEIVFRRIGRNELDAIQACLAYVDAQNEYAEKDRGTGRGAYAQRIVSSTGKKDGLYWPTSAGEDPSPLGDLVADATTQGYRVGERKPFHGYYFKVLTKQGRSAPGGDLDYIVGGKMIGGFALLAYPAEYRNSGVMSFIVNHAGVVYQKDLGTDTTRVAERMTAFDPDKTWQKVSDTEPVR